MYFADSGCVRTRRNLYRYATAFFAFCVMFFHFVPHIYFNGIPSTAVALFILQNIVLLALKVVGCCSAVV